MHNLFLSPQTNYLLFLLIIILIHTSAEILILQLITPTKVGLEGKSEEAYGVN